MTIKEKRKWLDNTVGTPLRGSDDASVIFYYKAMCGVGFSFADADNWAWLNTLFGYEIPDHVAQEYISWFNAHGREIQELNIEDKLTFIALNDWLGFDLDFSKFAIEHPMCMQFFLNPKDMFLEQEPEKQQQALMETVLVIWRAYSFMVNNGTLIDKGRRDVDQSCIELAKEFEYTFYGTKEYEQNFPQLMDKWIPEKLKEWFEY